MNMHDLKNSFKQLELVVFFSHSNLKSQYNRTIIGPWWETISLSILLLFLSIVWSRVVKEDLNSYLPYLVSSLITWRFISIMISQSCMIYLNSGELIKSFKINYSIPAFIQVYDKCLIFFHHLPIILVFNFLFDVDYLGITLLTLIYSVPIMLITSYSTCIILGFLNTRFRDLQSFVSMTMSIALFFTPVLWKAESMGPKTIFFIVNPNIFYHYIEIIRKPLIGELPSNLSMVITLFTTLILFSISQIMIKKYSTKITFWL